jgi:hypothetical protein
MNSAIAVTLLFFSLGLPNSVVAQNPDWPNGPNDDPREQYPADSSYIKFNDKGEVTGGQWNLWSFIPESWTQYPGFRTEELAWGTGIHADRAWQRTTGDRRVTVAVLDSGIKWDAKELQMKHFLNRHELGACMPIQSDPPASDPYDINGDGVFNIADYLTVNSAAESEWDEKGNQNGLMDPGDLIRNCSDGVDDDGNGYTDDISGWDTMWNDNNPYDDTRYGHGTGEARDSVAAGNDGHGGIGVCPECTLLNVRVGDSFVVDVNDFAAGVLFAVNSDAKVVQEALGSINNTPYAQAAIEYAYQNNVTIIASAADELSFHHNVPGTNNHTVYVHAIVYDGQEPHKSTTFLNFNNCTNFGAQLLLSTPGTGCSSEATGISSGHAGLIYSAAVQANLTPPLSAEEVRGVLIMSADDINIPEAATDSTKFPSGPGWDLHFGYGRNNARRSVDMVLDNTIPPEADIAEPLWFEPINVATRPTVDIRGRVGARVDGKPNRYDNYTWTLEWAPGVAPQEDWRSIAIGVDPIGGAQPATLATWDVAKASQEIDYDAPLTDPHQYTVTLRLRVTSTSANGELEGEFRKAVHLIKDPTLLEGFPRNFHTSLESSPKLVDLDGDLIDELVLSASDGTVHALKADGTEAAGWPAELRLRPEADPTETNNTLASCAFRSSEDKQGCTTLGSVDPQLARHSVMGTAAVGAMEGDLTDLSVVVLSFDGYAYVFDATGQLRSGWPQRTDPEHSAITDPDKTIDEGFFASPVLFDLDMDGDLEIVAAAMDQYVYVWHHDGSPMDGWPVLVKDPIETQRARIICTPAIGDVDADGFPEIAIGTNEVFGANGAENEARGYLLKHTGSPNKDDVMAALEPGWPVSTFGIIVNTLPMVGRGSPTNPILADLDGDGTLEINLDAIAFHPHLWSYTGERFTKNDEEVVMDNFNFGNSSNSKDAPAYTLINNGTFARFNPGDSIDIIKGTAGFDFALTFAEGGKRAVFDHQLSAWDTETGAYIEGFPQVVPDWQFFMNPVVIDLDGDDHPEVLNGSGGYMLQAFNYMGKQPKGFPKMLGGWIISSPTVGDLTGNGRWDVVNMTRAGWLFAWSTPWPNTGRVEWQSYGHDHHNTNNYQEPVAAYNHYTGVTEPPPSGSTSSGGCSTTSTGHPLAAWSFLLAMMVLLLGRRRIGSLAHVSHRKR